MMGTPSTQICAHSVRLRGQPKLGTVQHMANNLAKLRQERGWSQDHLAGLMDTTRNQLAKLEGGKRRLSDVWIDRAARALRVDPGALVSSATTVAIVGDVGAGGRVVYHGESQGTHEQADRPPGASDGTVAVRVQGNSMPGVAEDDWLIYFDERVAGFPEEWLGKVCVVWLPDDRVYVKRVLRGRDPGAFDLISTGSYDPMRDEEIAWSAKVSFIKPR